MNKKTVSPREMFDHRVELQVKRNRELRLQQERKEETKLRIDQDRNGNQKSMLESLLASTEAAGTGSFYTNPSTHIGDRTQWQ